MNDLASLLTAARADGNYTPLLRALPYLNSFGFRAHVDEEGLLLHLPFDPKIIGNPGIPSIHGGMLGASLESIALLTLVHEGNATWPRTVDFTVDYLRVAHTKDLFARATVLRAGRRIANVRMVCWQDDREKPVAAGRGNFQLV